MESILRVLHVDAASSFYRMERFEVGDFFGPVDLGLHLSKKHNSLNIGTGLLCGSIFPGSNRLMFSGMSPCWGNFYISSMGGAGLVFDNLGINMLSLRGKAPAPSVLYLNRTHGEEIEVLIEPVDVEKVWRSGRGGVYSMMDEVHARYFERYKEDPRILAVGPAAAVTDVGAVVSVPMKKGELTFVDTWAGRGGFGSKMFQEHGIAAVIYGGTYMDEDFRDRKVANEWFEGKYNQKMAAKDMEATTKYRHDPDLETGGTFGVNYSKMGGRIIAFNYRSVFMSEDDRLRIHKDLVLDHYLRQFNEETMALPRSQGMKNCGEPCVALCKKMWGEFKKDYEPYQTMGPLCGIFDQRAAEMLNHHADTLGFDAISGGGVVAWLMDCLDAGLLTRDELGVSEAPVFDAKGFKVVEDSLHNARLGVEIFDSIIARRGVLDMSRGPRAMARSLGKERERKVLDLLVHCASAGDGWMVPNQYWTAGVLSPMPIMGKYYMYYGDDFLEPRELGRKNAQNMKKELLLDNTGFCRFHRGWAGDMVPEIIETLWGKKEGFLEAVGATAEAINERNASVFWPSARNVDFLRTWLVRHRDVLGSDDPALAKWIAAFENNPGEAALEFWFEIQKGVHEILGAR